MTETKILNNIFSRKNLSPEYRLWKFRFKEGSLSHKTIEKILQKEGYVKYKEAAWKLA